MKMNCFKNLQCRRFNLEMKQLRRYLDGVITILIGEQGASPLGNLLGALKVTVVKDVVSFRIAPDALRAVWHN